ncbi:hypothetical protein CPB86DRAFT_789120 [Serendipita vermifera]|nr:hypothetical protein CPB86DRAFT_789120 [Serendipita vermifera]
MGVLEDYEIDYYDFPLTLYRIDYAGSQTTWSETWGFQAASGFTPQRTGGLRNAVQNHLNWSHRRYKSPFISTFYDRQHALHWAGRWIARNYGCCWIEEIHLEPYDFDVVRVFRVRDLVDRLDIPVLLEPSQYESEYLFLHRIPEEFIVSRIRLQ